MQADDLAKNTSQAVENLTKEAEQLKENATSLNNEANEMNYRVQETEIKLNKFYDRALTNDSLINVAKEAVSILFENQLIFL